MNGGHRDDDDRTVVWQPGPPRVPPQGSAPWGLPGPPAWPPLPPPEAPPTPKPKRNIGFVIAAAAVVVLVVVAAVLAVDRFGGSDEPATSAATTTSTPSSEDDSETTVDGEVLPALLLSANQIDEVLFTSGLQVVDEVAMYDDTTDPAECLSVFGAAERQAYDGSGFLGSAASQLAYTDGRDDLKDTTTQALIAYPAAADAEAFVAEQTGAWSGCASTDVEVDADGSGVMRVFDTERDDGVLTISWVQVNGTGWGCQRGIAAQRNVVIDVRTCDYPPPWQAPELVSLLADRVADA